ncbi:MAG: hypothetical protein AB8E15_05120 [Bdellovibrionales bacterium]
METNKYYLLSPLFLFLAMCLISSLSFAAIIPVKDHKIPKNYKAMAKQLKLQDDISFIKKKNAIKAGLLKPETRRTLEDRFSVSEKTFGIVREIKLEKEKNINVSEYREKAKVAIHQLAKANWGELRLGTANSFYAKDFKEFSSYLQSEMKNDLKLIKIFKDSLVFSLEWIRVRVYRNTMLADATIQFDYLADGNQLENGAMGIRAAGDNNKEMDSRGM